jgi:phospholipid-binding lipoprotein MlaA
MRLPRLLALRSLAAAVVVLGLAACATRPPASEPEALAEFNAANDPLEPLNRGMYRVNEAADTLVLRPAAEIYRLFLPYEVRLGVRNALTNLRAPTILASDLLQGQTERAGRTASRFLINSTLGLGGIIDVAERGFGIPGHNEDFGQTLAVWGVGSGPYLFVPGLGPSNPRDLLGFGVDVVLSPWFWVGQGATVEALRYSRTGATVVDTREGVIDTLDDINRTSLDPYTTIRSATRQRRAAEIRNDTAPAGARTGLAP